MPSIEPLAPDRRPTATATMMARLGRRILHIGLSGMGAGLLLVLVGLSGSQPGGWSLIGPLARYGFGLGMIFVPLFDIIMGEVRDHEVGSASSRLESLQQLGSSLGIAVLGPVVFATAGAPPLIGGFVHAAQRITGIGLVLIAVAFALGFLLSRRTRAHVASAPTQVDTPEAEPALV